MDKTKAIDNLNEAIKNVEDAIEFIERGDVGDAQNMLDQATDDIGSAMGFLE